MAKLRNPYASWTEEQRARCNIGECGHCNRPQPIVVEEVNGRAIRLCGDCGSKFFSELARANGRSKVAKPRKPAAVAAKPAKPAKPAKRPRLAPATPNVYPCMVPASEAPSAATVPQHTAPVPAAAPAPATAQPQAPAAALPTNTVDWARDARRRGWAVLHGMPEQQLRAYQARVEYLVSYPAAIAELARIESSRYWLTVNVKKAM